jgi:hypothetical protein
MPDPDRCNSISITKLRSIRAIIAKWGPGHVDKLQAIDHAIEALLTAR